MSCPNLDGDLARAEFPGHLLVEQPFDYPPYSVALSERREILAAFHPGRLLSNGERFECLSDPATSNAMESFWSCLDVRTEWDGKLECRAESGIRSGAQVAAMSLNDRTADR